MYGHRYFGNRYFGNHYWGDGGAGVPEPPEEGEGNEGGSVNLGWPRKKKRERVIRYSEYSTQEAYAAALAEAAIPLSKVREDGSVAPEDDFEDDDEILFAIVKLLH